MNASQIIIEARKLGLGERFAIWRDLGQDIYGDEGLPAIITEYPDAQPDASQAGEDHE
ncbi:hypothetical protein [Sphingomonas sp. DC1100-1]|uniref:hypothetical protein n=1 Tax=unclassified Sphingomonas TaxID=196159 RepID=UPI003CE827B5